MIFGRYSLIHATKLWMEPGDEIKLLIHLTRAKEQRSLETRFHESSIFAVVTRMSGPLEWTPGEKELPSWLRVIGTVDQADTAMLLVSTVTKHLTSARSYGIFGNFGDETVFAAVAPEVFREKCPSFKLKSLWELQHF